MEEMEMSSFDKLMGILKNDGGYYSDTKKQFIMMNQDGEFVMVESESPIAARKIAENDIKKICEDEEENLDRILSNIEQKKNRTI